MKLFLLFVLITITQMAVALPPANDAFTGRTVIGNLASYTVTTTNVEAGVQSTESTLSGLMGATIWWQWTAPASGWVRMDTIGSVVDTVLKVTSTNAVNGTLFGYNDDEFSGSGESSFSFQATSGTTYYIAIGGYDDGQGGGAKEGDITFSISMAAVDSPPNWPSVLTFSPTTANVTSADVNVTATITVAGDVGATGDVDLYFRRATGSTIDPPVVSYTSFTSGSVNAVNVVTFPRYLSPGVWAPRIDLLLDDGTTLEFGNATSGRPYLIPVTTTVTVTSATSDTIAPAVTAFSITPASVNVNNAAVNVSVSATITDAFSGVKVLQVYLYHLTNATFDLPLTLNLTSGTINNGVWTGTTTIPKEYPSDTYSVYLYVQDKTFNATSYGEYGTLDFPVTPAFNVTVTGGGVYWEWAYENIYPYSDDVDMSLDPNGDGLDNLTCYAFGLDPLDTAFFEDLPSVSVTGAIIKSLTFEFWRRVGASGVTYTPQICDNLQATNWVDFPGTPALINGDTEWEYMRMIDTENTTTKPKRFARMKLTYVDN